MDPVQWERERESNMRDVNLLLGNREGLKTRPGQDTGQACGAQRAGAAGVAGAPEGQWRQDGDKAESQGTTGVLSRQVAPLGQVWKGSRRTRKGRQEMGG